MIRYALLGLLREQPDYGYRLKRRFDDRVGTVWHLNIGQVYQTLQALDRAGFIDEIPEEPDNPHLGRRLYALTDKGRQLLERWLRRPPTRPHPIRDETLIRLVVNEPGHWAEALERISKQEHVYKRHLSRLLAQKRRLLPPTLDATVGAHFGVEAALLHTEAHLKWLDYCRQQLEERAGPTNERPPDEG